MRDFEFKGEFKIRFASATLIMAFALYIEAIIELAFRYWEKISERGLAKN